ncbi:MAG TPA: ribosome silencing factor [Anaerolineae bacterium]|nr:ribosome silencing factor [Caldilineae bacterium]HID33976.1 ribosome silencing factor [Anaerolineae bacterium]
MISLNAQELAHDIVDLLDEKQAQDIVMLDIRQLAPFADYFVIATATSERQSKSLVEMLVDALREQRVKPLFIEGESPSGWQLLDYGEVIVHIFSPELRDYYRLEELWHDAKVVVRMQ